MAASWPTFYLQIKLTPTIPNIMKTLFPFCIFLFLLSFNNAAAQVDPSHQRVNLKHLKNLTAPQKNVPTSYETASTNVPTPSIEHINLRGDTGVYNINYIDVLDSTQLSLLARDLDFSNYPLTVLHKNVFSANLNLLMEYDALIYQYEGLARTCDTLRALHKREVTSLRSLVDLEKERAESLRQSRDQIKAQADILNGQLKESLAIARDNTKPPFGKQLFRGIVWGAVGFATGVMIMEFAR